MTCSRLLSFVLLLSCFALFSACQEEEAANFFYEEPITPVKSPIEPIVSIKPTVPAAGEGYYVAETILQSDPRTTEILGQLGQLYFRLPSRPVGCPGRIGPLCDPTFTLLLAGYKGVDPERFSTEDGVEGAVYDPETGVLVAKLTDVDASDGLKLGFTVIGNPEISSTVLIVNFGTVYNTGKTPQFVNFEGELTADIFEFSE